MKTFITIVLAGGISIVGLAVAGFILAVIASFLYVCGYMFYGLFLA